jgi:uncharacterized protein (DUF427 family)
MKLPGPDHPITTAINPRRVRVMIGDHVIADTRRAVTLREAGYPAVQYFPREDVEMGFAGKTPHATECPYKGQASYYTFDIDGRILEDVAWSYEAPFPAMSDIKGHVAFYPDRVELYELDDPISHRAQHPHGTL